MNLPLPLGVLGYEGSTVIVVLNGLITLLLWPEFQRKRKAETCKAQAAGINCTLHGGAVISSGLNLP